MKQLEVKNLSKAYRHRTLAIDDLSFSVEKGEIFGIIGLSGAGKSTLIRCLASLEKPTSGTVYIDGSPITGLCDKELRLFRKNIGYIFQQFALFSGKTVFENIALPLRLSKMSPDEIKKRVSALLTLVGLSDRGHYYPKQLSGGQQQRIGIARALVLEPKILFCDEATSSLDPKTTAEILGLLLKINKELGVTIIVITHEMEVVKHVCDRVALMENGKIVEMGDTRDLLAHPNHPTTRKFLFDSLDVAAKEALLETPHILRLCFFGDKADKPVIADMTRATGARANILFGWIDQLKSGKMGNLVVALQGDPREIESGMRYLRQHVSYVESFVGGV